MKRVRVEIEPRVLAQAACVTPELSFEAVVHSALREFALRHLLRARARQAVSRREAARAPRQPLTSVS